jgi:hypothetical protein
LVFFFFHLLSFPPMLTPLRFLLLVLVGLVLGLAAPARATHILGGQLTYRYVSGNTYEVTLSFYRDCTGISLPTTAIVTARSSSFCSGGSTVTATLQATGMAVLGAFYCPVVR